MTKIDDKERQKVVDKVQKLYNLANDKSAQKGEVENALKMARKLLARYNLTLQDLDTADKEFIREVAFDGKTNRPSWQRDLLLMVCEYFFVMPMSQAGYNETRVLSGNNLRRYIIVGDKTNVQLANYTIGYLMREYKFLADDYMKHRKAMDSTGGGLLDMMTSNNPIGSGVKARNSFYHGLNCGMMNVLTRQVEEEQKEGLVLVRDPDLIKFVKSITSKSNPANSNADIDGDAYDQGEKQGSKIQIRSGIEHDDKPENAGRVLGSGK